MKILISITTTYNAYWRKKIQEAKKLGLTEVALFLTNIDFKERQEFFKKLKETAITSVPFVHLRSDMKPTEIDYLIKNYGTKVFNIHSQLEFPLKYDLSKYRRRIYMENTSHQIFEEIKSWAGICLDASHHEDKRLTKNRLLYQDVEKTLKKYKIGAWHLNSIRYKSGHDHYFERLGYDYHSFIELKEFDYCKRYKKYLPQHYIALELENSLAEQLEAKKYVEKILKLK